MSVLAGARSRMTVSGLLMPGAALGRYELLMPIAQGGMAAVWAARQGGSRGFEKTVAIKTMLPKLSDDPTFERMFLNEATLATRIQHPNVAQILDLGEQGELLYIVMEWVDGEALSTLMRAAEQNRGAGLPRDLVLGIVERTCWGLHAAHEVTNEHDQNAGIVHRDVSPQNILVGYNGAVKVVDFGVAKASGLGGGETNTGSLKGKVPFMSPEQAQCIHVDRRTDVFAIGVLLYRMTTGVHPFVQDSDLLTLQAIIAMDPVPPRQRDPSISPQLEAVILRCLAKDRDYRFANMAELAEAIAMCGRRVSEKEIASCIGGLLGPKGAERRATLKQAAKNLGWSTQTSDSLPQPHAFTPSQRIPSYPQGPASGVSSRVEVQMPTPSLTGPPRPDAYGRTFASVVGGPMPPSNGMSPATVAAIVIGALAIIGGLAGIGAFFALRRDAPAATSAHATASVPPVEKTSARDDAATKSGAIPPATTVTAAPSASAPASAAASAGPAASAKPPATPRATGGGGATKPPVPASGGSTSGDVDMGF